MSRKILMVGNAKLTHKMRASPSIPIWPHAFMASYGVGWALAFDVGVRLYGAEIVTFLALALLKWTPLFRVYPIVNALFGAYGLWVIAIVVSDLVNSTVLFDTLRNLATPIFGAAGFVIVASCITRAPRSLLSYFIATGVAKAVLGEPLFGNAFDNLETSWGAVLQDTNFFKVRFEPAVSPIAIGVAILLSRRSLIYGAFLLMAVSVCYFSLDARSGGLMMFFAGLATAFIHWGFRAKPRQAFVGAVVALSLSYGAYAAYVYNSLNNDNVGHNAAQLNLAQNPYNPISLLLIGRSEWLVMPQAIAERPIFGWGSWARDEGNRFAYLRAYRTGTTDLGQLDGATESFYIPAHSVVGAAWVWSGLLGFVSMVWLARLVWRMVATIPDMRFALLPGVCYLTAMLIWHFFFSPPQSVRLHFPVALGALIVFSSQVPQLRRAGQSSS